jgi:hypothetical protein
MAGQARCQAESAIALQQWVDIVVGNSPLDEGSVRNIVKREITHSDSLASVSSMRAWKIGIAKSSSDELLQAFARAFIKRFPEAPLALVVSWFLTAQPLAAIDEPLIQNLVKHQSNRRDLRARTDLWGLLLCKIRIGEADVSDEPLLTRAPPMFRPIEAIALCIAGNREKAARCLHPGNVRAFNRWVAPIQQSQASLHLNFMPLPTAEMLHALHREAVELVGPNVDQLIADYYEEGTSDEPWFYHEKGAWHQYHGRHAEASVAFTRAVELKPTIESALARALSLQKYGCRGLARDELL